MRKFLLFILCALGSLFIAFFLIDESALKKLVIFLGYPSILLGFLLWSYSLFFLQRQNKSLSELLPRRKFAWATIIAATGLLLLYEPFEFKIVFDELLLSACSQVMHFTRIAAIPQYANDYSGSYVFLESMLDKRPLFFPFLLSLVHDLTGYRYTNVFFLNGALTLVLVTLVYSVSRLLSNHRAGLLAVLLTGSLPLISVYATSGHFEILNLVMILMTIFLSFVYIRDPGETTLAPFALCLILLSQVRYENSIYLLPFGIMILLGWSKAERIILPWQVILCPVLLIVSSMHYRLILNQEHGFFQSGPNGRDQTFSLSYAAENLESAFRFLFSHGQSQPNAYLLSILGMASIFLFLYYAYRRAERCKGSEPKMTAMFIFFMAISLLNAVIIFFNFGLFHQYITSRLSLPLHLLWIIVVPFVAIRLPRVFLPASMATGLFTVFLTVMLSDPLVLKITYVQLGIAVVAFIFSAFWIWRTSGDPFRGLCYLVLLYILTVSMPVGHAHRYSQRYISNDMVEDELAFLKDHADKEKILWVSSAPYSALLLRVNCISPVIIGEQPAMLKRHLDEGNYDAVYFSRRMERIGMNQYKCIDELDVINEDVFRMETVRDTRMNLEKRLLISRISDVVLPVLDPVPADATPTQ